MCITTICQINYTLKIKGKTNSLKNKIMVPVIPENVMLAFCMLIYKDNITRISNITLLIAGRGGGEVFNQI